MLLCAYSLSRASARSSLGAPPPLLGNQCQILQSKLDQKIRWGHF